MTTTTTVTACIGKAARDLFPNVEGQGFFELLDGVFQPGEPASVERMPMHLHGLHGPLRVRILDFIYAPIFDVAALRERNEHLEREGLERPTVGGAYRQISPDLMGLVGAGGRYKKNNPAWQRVLGWSNAELRGEENAALNHGHLDHRMQIPIKPFPTVALAALVKQLLSRD